MTLSQVLSKELQNNNEELAKRLGCNYYTLATYKRRFFNGSLSVEKQRTIAEQLGYQLKKEEQWSRKKTR